MVLMGTYVRNEEKPSTAKTTWRKPPFVRGIVDVGVLTMRMLSSTNSPQYESWYGRSGFFGICSLKAEILI